MENLDAAERDRFAALAADWWDPDGPLRTLHDINACRLEYLARSAPLAGLRVLDLGCGGGLLASGLARAGARVTAIDAAAPLIEAARAQARASGLDIDYRVALSHELAASQPAEFDLVACMELVEHVPDVDALVADCVALLRPGGELVVSTLTRSPLSWALGIVAAEYLLRLVPRGTHDYASFIRPSELAASARRHGLETVEICGLGYNPLTRRARAGGPPRVNYLARFRRPGASPA